jgi:predicted metalloprotease with PDZ domain
MFLFLVLALLAIIASGCNATPTPAPIAKSTNIPIAPTATETTTAIVAPAATTTGTATAMQTATPRIMPTTTSTATPTSTPDYSSLGNPATPIPYSSEWIPSGFLQYNDADFDVFRRTMHNRPVTIAFAKDVPLSNSQRRKVAEFALDTWAMWWEVFGGFPWPSYTIVIRNEPRRSPAGELGIGWEDDAKHLSRSGDYEEFVGHGIFHAWWGNFVEHASNHVDPATPEGWASEGFTQYYGDRAGGPTVYRQWIREHWSDYQRMRGTKYDVPLIEMGAYAERTGDKEYWRKVYWKGALVAYMIDQKLHEKGLNLDHLMRHMYERFGLTRQRYETEDVRTSLETITGQSWGDFFSKYVYGTQPLPLDGTFKYLEH